MARTLCLIAVAFAAAGCAGPRFIGAAPDSPAWLEERVAAAEASDRGYPRLEDVPEYAPATTSRAEWRQGVDDMTAVREQVLNDPAMIDPDQDADAADFTRQSRADAARDLARQTVEDDE
jgi:hypothetical protein